MFFEQGSKMMVLLVMDVCSIQYFFFTAIIFSTLIKNEIISHHSDTVKELIMSLIFCANVIPNIILPSYIQGLINRHGHRKLFFIFATASFIGQNIFLISLYHRSNCILLIIGRFVFGFSQDQIFRIITGFLPNYFRKKNIGSRNRYIIISSNLIGVSSFIIVPISLLLTPNFTLAIIINFVINTAAFLAASLTVFYDIFLEDLSWRRKGVKTGGSQSNSLIIEKPRHSQISNNLYRSRTYTLSLMCAVFYFSSLLSYNYYGEDHNEEYFQFIGEETSFQVFLLSQFLFFNFWATAFVSSIFGISYVEKNFNRTEIILVVCLLLVFAQIINIIFSPIIAVFLFGICYSIGYKAFFSLWECLENIFPIYNTVLNVSQTLLPCAVAIIKWFDANKVIDCGFFSLVLAVVAVGISLHLYNANQHDDSFLDIKKEDIVLKNNKQNEQELFEFKECVIQSNME